jgi:NADPH:quinone reductase-like Zn-dependent oxidoreductase
MKALRVHAALWVGFKDRTLNPVVGRTLALAQAAYAHHDISEGAAIGKLVLVP